MKIERRSMLTGKVATMEIDITQEQYESWYWGAPIQVVMPNVSADEREFIITGITPEEWKNQVGGEEK